MPYKKIILSLAVLGLLFSFNLPVAKAMTAEEIQTKINDLLSQLQVLQAQQGITETDKPPLPSWCHDFTVNLKIGNSGTEVKSLQKALGLQGVYQGELTGVFDETTASAVSGFQEKYSTDILSSYDLTRGTGYFGKGTRVKMNQLYGCKTPEQPRYLVSSLSIEPNSAGRQLYIGETATFYATLKNASSSSPVYSYLQKPDGTYQISGRYEGITNTEGYLFKKEVYEIDAAYSQVGTYKAWVNVGGRDSNIVELSVATANRPPVIFGVGGPTSLNVNETGTWRVNAYDPDGTYLYYGIDWGDYGAKLTPTKKTASVNAGSPEATFTHSYAAAGTYKITFTVSDAQGASAQTTLTVNVGTSSITILSPNGGEQWNGDKLHWISWTSSGNPYSQIDLLIAGYDSSGNQIGDWKLIAAGVSISQGFYYWVPSGAPLYLPSGFTTTPSKYRIQIREANDSPNAITDISDNYFQISFNLSITLFSPNGGEQWHPGETHRVSWKSVNVNQIKIYIYDSNIIGSGSTNYITPDNIPISASQGYYDWTIPLLSKLPPFGGSGSSNYRIRIDTEDSPAISDYSDAPFSIVPPKTIQPPTPTTLQDIENQLASIAQQILLLTEKFKGTNR